MITSEGTGRPGPPPLLSGYHSFGRVAMYTESAVTFCASSGLPKLCMSPPCTGSQPQLPSQPEQASYFAFPSYSAACTCRPVQSPLFTKFRPRQLTSTSVPPHRGSTPNWMTPLSRRTTVDSNANVCGSADNNMLSEPTPETAMPYAYKVWGSPSRYLLGIGYRNPWSPAPGSVLGAFAETAATNVPPPPAVPSTYRWT